MNNPQRGTFIGGAVDGMMASPKPVKADDDKTEAPTSFHRPGTRNLPAGASGIRTYIQPWFDKRQPE